MIGWDWESNWCPNKPQCRSYDSLWWTSFGTLSRIPHFEAARCGRQMWAYQKKRKSFQIHKLGPKSMLFAESHKFASFWAETIIYTYIHIHTYIYIYIHIYIYVYIIPYSHIPCSYFVRFAKWCFQPPFFSLRSSRSSVTGLPDQPEEGQVKTPELRQGVRPGRSW